jgi:hypothetical protein
MGKLCDYCGYNPCGCKKDPNETTGNKSPSVGGYATLNNNDMYMAALLEQMLKDAPYPTSDTRWQMIERWAEEVRVRAICV